MAINKYQIVVQGEASETDSDDEVYITSMSAPSTAAAGAKVSGEASETDSEDEVEKARKVVIAASSENARVIHKELPPLIVVRDNPAIPSVVEDRPVSRSESTGQFNSLLQQKLLENNARLYIDVSQSLRHVYGNATKEIRVATGHLNNSQSGIINASHSIRLILEDLKSVSEKIDIITSCHLLPEITMPSMSAHPASAPGQ